MAAGGLGAEWADAQSVGVRFNGTLIASGLMFRGGPGLVR
jgi:hypothetical protein